MISDEKRQEVAENLRILSDGNRVRYKEEFYDLLDETVMEPDTGYHEINDVFGQLADLIDLDPQERMCTFNVCESYTQIHRQQLPTCSACGYETEWDECTVYGDGTVRYEQNYCPNCGAKVVKED